MASPTNNVPFQAFGRPDVDRDGVIDGADSCPSAPNSYRVAHARGPIDVWSVGFDGSQYVRLTTNASTITDTDPRFDSSGRRIVFTSNRIGNDYEIYVMNADGSDPRRLTSTPGRDIQPAFSPDGARIVHIGTRSTTSQNAVWSMNADGSAPQLLVAGGDNIFAPLNANPVYSPDGTRIAFDARRGNLSSSNLDIYSIAADGTDERRLTNAAGDDAQPAYSRDGTALVFISRRDGAAQNGEIYIMKPDGSEQRRITRTTFSETTPTFSPDGLQIVFSANYDGTPELYAINRDGTGLRRVTVAPSGFLSHPTLAPQADADSDGTGDACDPAFNAATAVGAPVVVQAPAGSVEFGTVTGAGVTTFTAIQPDPNGMPAGYTLCATCPAYDITTTAVVVPPITVCIAVPTGVPAATFQQLRLLHGENGQWVDRTTLRIDQPGVPRQVCGVVDSLSPFALAAISSTPVDAVFGNGFE